jgi:hypothetical protein
MEMPRLTAFSNRIPITSDIDFLIHTVQMSRRNYITLDELLNFRHAIQVAKVRAKARRLIK